jgi:hypothetical protein
MWTPGRIKNSIYHAHEFYKTVKKRVNNLYSAYLARASDYPPPPKQEVFVFISTSLKERP